jgi:hypothetical protein
MTLLKTFLAQAAVNADRFFINNRAVWGDMGPDPEKKPLDGAWYLATREEVIIN